MAYPGPFGHPQPYVPAPTASSGMATASMVLGIIGIFSCGVTSVLAIVFGHIGERQTQGGRMLGRGQAIAGLVLGYITAAPWLFFWVMVIMGAVTAPFVGSTAP